MTVITPVWVWLPDRNEPTRAGELVHSSGSRFIYRLDYLKTQGALALDPVELRLSRSARGTAILASDGLQACRAVLDAKPAGYGKARCCVRDTSRSVAAQPMLDLRCAMAWPQSRWCYREDFLRTPSRLLKYLHPMPDERAAAGTI